MCRTWCKSCASRATASSYPRNLWRLFNAFTEAFKSQSPTPDHTTMQRSDALHGLCDGVVGLAN